MRFSTVFVGCIALHLLVAGHCSAQVAQPNITQPNIVVIYGDDIGYGDFGCYGAIKVKTPHVDRLAKEGLRFTDAHSAASVCTPSRYALMTGEYAFRKKGTGIASGVEGLLIEPGRTTVATVLKKVGYTNAIIGKWHLGLGTSPTDYNGEIKPGPLEIGFDYSWIIPATGDRVPCVWVENHRVVNFDPADRIQLDYSVQRGSPASFVAGIPRIGSQTGGKSALWNDQEMAGVIAAKSCEFIEKNQAKPFFLFMSSHNIHVPRAPHPRFKGASDCGVRGDAIVEFDWMVGQVLEQLDRLKLADNTLVVLSSDNGGVLDNNGPDIEHGIGPLPANNGHLFNGVLRGTKGSVWEGGTRLPFIARWPARIKPGVSDALICQVDLLATFAALTGQTLGEADGPDSFNQLPALLSENRSMPCREYLIEQNNNGALLALRKGPWKLVPAGAANQKGKAVKNENRPAEKAGRAGNAPRLYNLAEDLSETKDLAAEHPEIVKELVAKLNDIKNTGRSRP